MDSLDNVIDITKEFGCWLGSLPCLEEFFGDRIIDTIDEDKCDIVPFIYYRRTGQQESNCMEDTSCLPERAFFVIELVGKVCDTPTVRKLETVLRTCAKRHGVMSPFGCLCVQMIKVEDVDDDYIPRASQIFGGTTVSTLQVQIVPSGIRN